MRRAADMRSTIFQQHHLALLLFGPRARLNWSENAAYSSSPRSPFTTHSSTVDLCGMSSSLQIEFRLFPSAISRQIKSPSFSVYFEGLPAGFGLLGFFVRFVI